MPSRPLHRMFDEHLRERGVICEDTSTDSVHRRLDRNAKIYGPDHREIDNFHTEEGVRAWLDNMPPNVYQDTKTDLLRCGLGHLVLDEIKDRHPRKSERQLIRTAYRSFSQRGFHRKYYRENESGWKIW